MLSPQEEALLELVREGRVDAEIAVRLGISNRDVKDRVEALAAKLGVPGREGLLSDLALSVWEETAARPVPVFRPRVSERRSYGFVALIALTLGAAMAVAALNLWDKADTQATDGREGPVVISPAGTPGRTGWVTPLASAPSDPAPRNPTRRPTTIAGRAMLDLGPLFTVPVYVGTHPSGIRDIQTREELLVVTLDGEAVIELENGTSTWRFLGRGPAYLTLDTQLPNEDTLAVHFSAVGDTRFLLGAKGSFGIYTTRPDARPTVAIWAEKGSGNLHLELSNGLLFVSDSPTAATAAVARDTGESLNRAGAHQLGRVEGAWTLCAEPGAVACVVVARPPFTSPMLSPAEGSVRCHPDGYLVLETKGFDLQLRELKANGEPGGPECVPRPDRFLRAGDELSQGKQYTISAVGPEDDSWDVFVAGDGTLYVGPTTPQYGCPCRTGN